MPVCDRSNDTTHARHCPMEQRPAPPRQDAAELAPLTRLPLDEFWARVDGRA